MSYRAGIGGALAYALGGMPRDPHIVCDGCGLRRTVYSKRGDVARWFLARKPAPGWELVKQADTRDCLDYCPECKARRKEVKS